MARSTSLPTYSSVHTALTGNGTINGNVVMAAAANVSPGLSAGKLDFANDLSLGSSGTLSIQLGGTTPVTGYDQINVAGALAFAGTLQVSLINSFLLSPGNTFNILDFASHTGTFGSVILPAGTWDQSALYTTGILTYVSAGSGIGSGGSVPEPTTVALLSMAAAGFFGASRTRHRRR